MNIYDAFENEHGIARVYKVCSSNIRFRISVHVTLYAGAGIDAIDFRWNSMIQ